MAYLLARGRFPGRVVVAALVDLPLLIPHPVAGIALLLALGRQTAAGSVLAALGRKGAMNWPVPHTCRMISHAAEGSANTLTTALAEVSRLGPMRPP